MKAMLAPQNYVRVIKFYGRYAFSNRAALSLRLKDHRDVAERMSIGKSFQIFGVSKANLVDLYEDRLNWGTTSKTLCELLWIICLGFKKDAK